jgi:hypothetical protein
MRVVIPPKFRDRPLDEVHKEHPGIVCMKAWIRSYFWYPSVDADVEKVVKACDICQTVNSTPPTAPLYPWQPSGKVWERLHIDFAEFERLYLIS